MVKAVSSTKLVLSVLLPLVVCCCMLLMSSVVFNSNSFVSATSVDCNNGKTSGSDLNVKRSAATAVLALDQEEIELLESYTNAETLAFRFRAMKRIGNSIGKTVRRIVGSTSKIFASMSRLYRRRSVSIIVGQSKPSFTGYIGPTNREVANRTPFTSTITVTLKQKEANVIKKFIKKISSRKSSSKQTFLNTVVPCATCKVDCMKAYSSLGGSIFDSCTKQYYVYGCERKDPCYRPETSSDDEIEGIISVCILRNGCQPKKQFRKLDDQKVFNRMVKGIRSG